MSYDRQSEEGEERNWQEDRRLSVGEIKKLQNAGYDIHDLKRDCPAGVPARCDLFKDRNGNIYVKPKNGRGAGESVDINIYEL